jgi:hypothetical protein
MENKLTDSLIGLARTRRAKEEASAEQKALLEQLHSTPAWQEASSKFKAASAQETTLDAEVRQFALERFKKLGQEGLVKGVKKVDKTIFEVKDEAKAIQWCEENAPVAVTKKLDLKLFKGIAGKMHKAGSPMPFLKLGKEPAINIDTDLSFLLEDPSPGETVELAAVQDNGWRSIVNG